MVCLVTKLLASRGQGAESAAVGSEGRRRRERSGERDLPMPGDWQPGVLRTRDKWSSRIA